VGEAIAARHGGVAISAVTRAGLAELITRAEDLLFEESAPAARKLSAAGQGAPR
jgi:hypothetical protein